MKQFTDHSNLKRGDYYLGYKIWGDPNLKIMWLFRVVETFPQYYKYENLFCISSNLHETTFTYEEIDMSIGGPVINQFRYINSYDAMEFYHISLEEILSFNMGVL